MTPDQVRATTPRTVVGRWLLASVIGSDLAIRTELARKLNGGRDGMNPDEPAVVAAACEAMLKRVYPAPPPDSEIDRLVSVLARNQSGGWTEEQFARVMRASLGQGSEWLDGLRPLQVTLVQALLVGALCFGQRMTASDTAKVISDAENEAFEQGWHPPIDE